MRWSVLRVVPACRASECSGLPARIRSWTIQITGAATAYGIRRAVALAGGVDDREAPGLGSEEAGEAEEDEHEARVLVARLGEDRAQHERHVRDVEVGAHTEAQHRDAGEDQRGGDDAGGGAEPVRAELVRRPGERAQAEEGDPDPERLAEVAERRQQHPQRGRERVRRGGERQVEVRRAAVQQVPAPQQAVGRVVVQEARADEGEREQRSERDSDRGAHADAASRATRLNRPLAASLYRRHRPRTFADVVGQEHVVRTLSNAIEQDRVHHAYLFVGSRGTGKTSMAKILAASLNCRSGGPTVSPCGKCESCLSIQNATSLDVVEMDAASNNSVDDVRELRERVAFAPVGGGYKVYILDEAHMLTPQAWNAFLKTLEEPPPHTIFVLATTEANKVLPTVVDRCHRFDFGRPSVPQLAHVLRRAADAESISIPDEAVALVARSATGSFRDALGTLEQLLAYSGSTIALEDVLAVLGAADADLIFGAVDAVSAGDARSALLAAASLAESGRDLGRFFGDLEAHARALMVVQVLGDVPPELRVTSEQDERLAEQAARVGQAEVVRLIELIAVRAARVEGRRRRPHPAGARAGQGRHPDLEPSVKALQARIARLESRPAAPAPRTPDQPQTAAGRATSPAAASSPPAPAPAGTPRRAAKSRPAPVGQAAPPRHAAGPGRPRRAARESRAGPRRPGGAPAAPRRPRAGHAAPPATRPGRVAARRRPPARPLRRPPARRPPATRQRAAGARAAEAGKAPPSPPVPRSGCRFAARRRTARRRRTPVRRPARRAGVRLAAPVRVRAGLRHSARRTRVRIAAPRSIPRPRCAGARTWRSRRRSRGSRRSQVPATLPGAGDVDPERGAARRRRRGRGRGARPRDRGRSLARRYGGRGGRAGCARARAEPRALAGHSASSGPRSSRSCARARRCSPRRSTTARPPRSTADG